MTLNLNCYSIINRCNIRTDVVNDYLPLQEIKKKINK